MQNPYYPGNAPQVVYVQQPGGYYGGGPQGPTVVNLQPQPGNGPVTYIEQQQPTAQRPSNSFGTTCCGACCGVLAAFLCCETCELCCCCDFL